MGHAFSREAPLLAETPELSDFLAKRIQLVRRDIGALLFHFTRTPDTQSLEYELPGGGQVFAQASAGAVLSKILHEGLLRGSGRWSGGRDCVCFSEAPIQELNALFSLIAFASSEAEHPRYEPYGIAVSKQWLFAQGGRPVIYDHPDSEAELSETYRYRFVPYDPSVGRDFTWEREWRIETKVLALDPRHTLVVVPTANEAFGIVNEFADEVPDYDNEPVPTGVYLDPTWLAVSLDLFGLEYHPGVANTASEGESVLL